MCLIINEQATKRLLLRFGDKKWIYLYKIVRKRNNKLNGEYQQSFQYIGGWNKAIGKAKKKMLNYSYDYVIEGGAIHLYTSKKEALIWCCYTSRVIPVKVYKKDLVSGGTRSQAVFKKIWIDKKIYQAALKATSKSECLKLQKKN